MKEINLRDYYPFYTTDMIVEVPDEVADLLYEYKLSEAAHFLRTYRHKAYFSLDYDENVERDALVPGTQAAIDAVTELIVSGEWDVFSGVKLHITINEDGTAAVTQEEADLRCDGQELVDGALVERDPVVVAAGGASVEDSVITGSMNYFVEGVEDA